MDAAWPAAGTKIHHSVGAWPLLVNDETEVVTSLRPGRLVLTTRARPFGVARVTLTMEPDGAGTTVTMQEVPTGGPGRWLHNPFNDGVLRLRNVETLARLAAIAERR